jgi:hypothetical protein
MNFTFQATPLPENATSPFRGIVPGHCFLLRVSSLSMLVEADADLTTVMHGRGSWPSLASNSLISV